MKVVVKVPWARPPKTESPLDSSIQSNTETNSASYTSSSNFLSSQKSIGDSNLSVSSVDKPIIIKSGWTPEKDQQLWTWLSLYPNPQFINWEFIASRLNSTVEECIKRSGELYQQQLQFIQQHLSNPKSSNIYSPSSKPRTPSNTSILIPSTYLRPQTRNFENRPNINSNSMVYSQVNASSINDPNVMAKLQKSVLDHDFDWASIARELEMSPLEARNMYLSTVQPLGKSSSQSDSTLSNSVTMTEILDAMSSRSGI